MGMHPSGGTGIQPGIILGLHSDMVPSFVHHLRDEAHLPADVFRSLDHDMDSGGDDMAPLEHHLASWPSSSPHPSLDTT